ncbi:MAG: hypothetical protein F7B59_08230 [Desulfurococcales archaeon]|nr:hypothetical protein [Desulfurococcales archaeon]
MPVLSKPPRIKIFEALGSIADGRVEIVEENDSKVTAKVKSSTGEKTYTVIVDLNSGAVYSDDNGTIHRGYIGYPIIAVLMMKGVLPFEGKYAEVLKGIPWKTLNETYKKYSVVEEIAFKQARSKGVYRRHLEAFAKRVLGELGRLELKFDESLAKQS